MSEEGSGLQFMSAGSVESLYLGSTYEIKVGSVYEIMVGSEAKINAAVSNSLSLEAEMAYKYGCGVEWSNVGGYKLEQGEAFELKEESSQFATRELKFQAARTLPAQGVGVPLDAIKNRIRGLLVTLAAINVAIGAAEGVALGENSLGETENRPNEEGVEQDGWKAGSVGVATSAVTALGSLVGYALIKKSIEGLMEVYKALPAVSTLTLSDEGITQQTNFTATGSLLEMSATGVEVKSGAGTVAVTGHGDLSSLALPADGNAVLNGDLSTTVKSPVVVKVGQLVGDDLSSGLSAEVDAVSLKNTNASQVRLLPEAAEMRALEVNVHSGVNGFSANAEEAKMACGPTAVTASNISLTMGVDGGACEIRLYPSFVVVDGPLIQLG